MANLLVFGGTGSLGKSLLKHFINDYDISVVSRDEAKHVVIKQMYPTVHSIIGDVRDRDSVISAFCRAKPDVVINAAALKNVPEVEEVPMEGIKTSLLGTENINIAARQYVKNSAIKVLTISTDKATSPINSYGMAKALQERLHLRSNTKEIICNAVRYGNVLESRGSLIPLLKQRFKDKQTVYITHPDMTRFFLTLDASVELIKTALLDDSGGKVFIPNIRSAKIADVIEIFREFYDCEKSLVQSSRIRPGEKIDELLIGRGELSRTEKAGNVFKIHDILSDVNFDDVKEEFSSGSPSVLLSKEELYAFLKQNGIFDEK